MNLIVLGATRGIGYQVITQALEAGHTVTAVVRRPQALTLAHPNLKIVVGDALKEETFAGAMEGQEVVVSAIGDTSTKPTTLYSDGVGNMIKAMQGQGIKRLFCISASALETGPGQSLLMRKVLIPLVQRFLKEPYADLTRMEKVVESSPTDWTIVRPPRLTDKPGRGQYKVALNAHLNGFSLSRADVADYILTHLIDPKSYHAKVELAY